MALSSLLKVPIHEFESFVNSIENEDDRNFVRNCYRKNVTEGVYTLKKNVEASDIPKLQKIVQ